MSIKQPVKNRVAPDISTSATDVDSALGADNYNLPSSRHSKVTNKITKKNHGDVDEEASTGSGSSFMQE